MAPGLLGTGAVGPGQHEMVGGGNVAERSPEDDRDAQLMLRVAGGDLHAFEHLVLRHQDGAWSLAWR